MLRVLRSGWITTGKETAAFEEEFARYVGAPAAIAVNSCTSALYLALKALDIGPGDEVIVPAITWPATANVVVELGATPVFSDVDVATGNVTAELVSAALSPKTKAIFIVHYAGLACEMGPLLELAEKRGVPIIEDAAHATGASYRGEKIGRPHGVIACFSFHPAKNLTTGEGAMMTVANEKLAARLRTLKFHGVNRDAWSRYRSVGVSHYDIAEPSLKFNLPDILSAMGRVQLNKLDELNMRRAHLSRLYREELASVEQIALPPAIENEGGCNHLFAIRVTEKAPFSRDDFSQRLGELNIGTGLHFLPVHQLSYYRSLHPGLSLPGAERFGKQTLSLPLFPGMSDEDVRYVCSAIRAFLA